MMCEFLFPCPCGERRMRLYTKRNSRSVDIEPVGTTETHTTMALLSAGLCKCHLVIGGWQVGHATPKHHLSISGAKRIEKLTADRFVS